MVTEIILASASESRRKMLENANVPHRFEVSKVSEKPVQKTGVQNNVHPSEIANLLAGLKAADVSKRNPTSTVIGCDQVLEFNGNMMNKATNKQMALKQLTNLSGKSHRLYSAVSVFENGTDVWQFTGKAELTMRPLSRADLETYLGRNWDAVRDCVGCYMLEEEGSWLFSKVSGDYFTVLGLPLIQLLGYLSGRGVHPA